MRIDGTGYSSYISFADRQAAKNATTTTASPSSTGSGSGVDWTNVSSSQFVDGMNSLIKSGKMTFDQSSGMVGLAKTALTQAPGAATSASDTSNVLAELKSGIAGSESRGDTASAERLADVLNILESTSGTQGVNITA